MYFVSEKHKKMLSRPKIIHFGTQKVVDQFSIGNIWLRLLCVCVCVCVCVFVLNTYSQNKLDANLTHLAERCLLIFMNFTDLASFA